MYSWTPIGPVWSSVTVSCNFRSSRCSAISILQMDKQSVGFAGANIAGTYFFGHMPAWLIGWHMKPFLGWGTDTSGRLLDDLCPMYPDSMQFGRDAHAKWHVLSPNTCDSMVVPCISHSNSATGVLTEVGKVVLLVTLEWYWMHFPTHRWHFIIIRGPFDDLRVVSLIEFHTGGQNHDNPFHCHLRCLMEKVQI